MRSEDGYFVRKCLDGDPTAFGFLVDKYKACVYAFTYSRLHNFHDAEDLTQETFIKAYRKLNTLKRYDSFLAWLYAIASNLCKMYIRTQSRRPDKEYIEDHKIEELESPSIDSYHDDMANKSLREALDSLPDAYQEVLTLYYFGGMDGKEIARFLGISHDNVKQRLVRARLQLKEEVITMMSATFQQERLQASFTFRIVEAIKRIKIHPMSTTKGVPWGVSIAAGIIFTILSLGSRIMVSQYFGTPISFSLPSESKVLNIGEIPVDVVKVDKIPFLSSHLGKGGESKRPDMQNAFLMAPKGEGGMWKEKSSMSITRVGDSCNVVNSKIYVIGGYGGVKQGNLFPYIPEVEEYDPSTDRWTKKSNMPTPRNAPSCVLNGKIYLVGGYNGGFFPIVEEYDPKTDTWVKKADLATVKHGASLQAVNGKIYAIGGATMENGNLKYLSTVEEYDPILDKWTKKADMSSARVTYTAVVNGKIYAFGGLTQVQMFSTVEEYDPVADKWTRKADMPIAKSSSVVSMDGKIYIIGGETDADILTTVEEYDPVNDTWTPKTDLPVAKFGFGVGTVNGRIYAIGGSSGQGPTSLVLEFTPDDWQASFVSPQGKLPTKWGNIKSR